MEEVITLVRHLAMQTGNPSFRFLPVTAFRLVLTRVARQTRASDISADEVIGGNVGTHFYTYEKYLQYPPDVKWTVCDVPTIVRFGEELAQEEGRQELTFTTQLEEADGAHISIASGSIQYLALSPTILMLRSSKVVHKRTPPMPQRFRRTAPNPRSGFPV